MPNCEMCGEPMPPGEEMFKYHGYSGPCPGPPLPSLVKRPVAFRVKNNIGAWVYYEDEERASKAAEQQHTDYQGLYVRDGT